MSVLLSSRQSEASFLPSGSDPLQGPSGIPSQAVIAQYEGSYSELDRRVGLALFDRAYQRGAFAALKESLVEEQQHPAIRQGSLVAVAG